MKKDNWFAEARFGLFIHWGLYSIPAAGEWIYARRNWHKHEYENLMHQFNPVHFAPAQWARLARTAGMKYVVFTTRHHDGFCMFDSHYTDYKITNTPYRKDVTRMLVDAVRAEGLRIGFYHSLPDWTHPGYADPETPEFILHKKLHTPTPEQHLAFQELLYCHLEQLMTEYGKIDLLYLDYTSRFKAGVDYFGRDRLLDMIYGHQPEILVNDRLAYLKNDVRDFDYYTPEVCMMNQPLRIKEKEVLWETSATINDHWGYFKGDDNYKDAETITAAVMGCVSQNGNLLLNIAPDAEGNLDSGVIRTLNRLSEWNKCHQEAVFACGKSLFTSPFGCCYTQRGNVIYCYLLVCPVGDIILPELRKRIQRITLLRTGDEIELINDWGRELLNPNDQRIRPRGVQVGDVLKIVLK